MQIASQPLVRDGSCLHGSNARPAQKSAGRRVWTLATIRSPALYPRSSALSGPRLRPWPGQRRAGANVGGRRQERVTDGTATSTNAERTPAHANGIRVKSNERHGADELEKRRDANGKRRRTLQIRCRDAGELLDLRQERALGSRERGELPVYGPVDDPASADLDDLVIRWAGPVSVRLEIEHYVIAAGRDRRRNAIVAE